METRKWARKKQTDVLVMIEAWTTQEAQVGITDYHSLQGVSATRKSQKASGGIEVFVLQEFSQATVNFFQAQTKVLLLVPH